MDFILCKNWEWCKGLYILSSGWEYLSGRLAVAKLKTALNIQHTTECPKCRPPTIVLKPEKSEAA